MTVVVFRGHAPDLLDGLPAGHFHTCVTSPPYWKLRAYGTPPQTWADGWTGELGQEATPEAYVAHLLEVFASVRRVLRDDGTLWVNISGGFWNEPGGQNGAEGRVGAKAIEANRQNGRQRLKDRPKHAWLKRLDWVDIPGLFARAVQGAGWVWRSDVTWVKPSALPESVSGTRWERCRVKTKDGRQVNRAAWMEAAIAEGAPRKSPAHTVETVGGQPAEWADCPGCPKCAPHGGLVLRRGNGRPTKATEAILLFAKQPGYYFDQEAVREPLISKVQRFLTDGDPTGASEDPKNARAGGGLRDKRRYDGVPQGNPAGRNLRDWWVIGPEPLSEAHYAAYPTALPERCIKAGTSEWGCCPACGAPWARVVESRGIRDLAPLLTGGKNEAIKDDGQRNHALSVSHSQAWAPEVKTLGWRPTCRCPEAPPVPCRVLDPFGGSGSTGLAANRLGRDCTLLELKDAYADLARKRLSREPLSLFAYQPPEEAPV